MIYTDLNIIMTELEIKEHNRLWYKKTYDSLIEKGKLRGNSKTELDYYTESHHIIPRCVGGTDEGNNLVLLTYKEHVIAHRLLVEIYPNNYNLLHAASLMLSTNIDKNGNKISEIDKFSLRKAVEYKEMFLKESREHYEKLSQTLRGKKKTFKNGKPEPNKGASKKVIDSNGNIFNSVKDCAEHYNYSSSSIIRWIKEGKNGFSYLDKTYKTNSHSKVIYFKLEDKIFYNILECCDYFKKDSKTILNWIENYPDKGLIYREDINTKRKTHSEDHKKKISETLKKNSKSFKKVQGPDGITYRSMKECSEHFKHDRHVILKWIRNNPEKGFKFV